MKIETQTLEDHQVKLKVEADPQQVQDAKQRAARAIARRTKIPGFRPGKAPYHIVERFAGEEQIYQDAVELLVNDIYPKAIDESGIKPYGPGKLEDISKDPLTFEFILPLEAEVDLGEYQSLRLPYELTTVSEDEVDKVLENMRIQQAILEPVERPAQEGDQVQIKIQGERKNPKEGESPTLIREMPVPVVIEPEETGATEEGNEEWPFPGFSRELIGLSQGDEKTIPYTYPEDTPFESLQGTEVEFQIAVEGVKSRELPELNDEFAVSQGDYETMEALRAEIRTRLEERARDEYDDEYGNRVLESLLEQAQIKFPPQMLEAELESVLHDLEHRLSRQNLDMETYLKTRQIDRPALEDELRPTAENRLKRMLILFEAGKLEDVKVKNEDIQSETINTINQAFGNMPPEQARKELTRETISQLTNNITADLLVRNTLSRLRAIAKGEGEAEAQADAGTESGATTEVEAGTEAAAPAEAEAEAGVSETEAVVTETPEVIEPPQPDETVQATEEPGAGDEQIAPETVEANQTPATDEE